VFVFVKPPYIVCWPVAYRHHVTNMVFLFCPANLYPMLTTALIFTSRSAQSNSFLLGHKVA